MFPEGSPAHIMSPPPWLPQGHSWEVRPSCYRGGRQSAPKVRLQETGHWGLRSQRQVWAGPQADAIFCLWGREGCQGLEGWQCSSPTSGPPAPTRAQRAVPEMLSGGCRHGLWLSCWASRDPAAHSPSHGLGQRPLSSLEPPLEKALRFLLRVGACHLPSFPILSSWGESDSRLAGVRWAHTVSQTLPGVQPHVPGPTRPFLLATNLHLSCPLMPALNRVSVPKAPRPPHSSRCSDQNPGRCSS